MHDCILGALEALVCRPFVAFCNQVYGIRLMT